jgi:hypothetical protein
MPEVVHVSPIGSPYSGTYRSAGIHHQQSLGANCLLGRRHNSLVARIVPATNWTPSNFEDAKILLPDGEEVSTSRDLAPASARMHTEGRVCRCSRLALSRSNHRLPEWRPAAQQSAFYVIFIKTPNAYSNQIHRLMDALARVPPSHIRCDPVT